MALRCCVRGTLALALRHHLLFVNSHGGQRPGKTRAESPSTPVGATGFDRVVLRWAASRGLLATLNRGTVKLN